MSLPRSFIALQNETYLPFLYCTRTLVAPASRRHFYSPFHNLRPAPRCPFSTSSSLRSRDTRPDKSQPRNKPDFDTEDDTSELSSDYLKLRSSQSLSGRISRKATKKGAPKTKSGTTITPAEQKTLERLYKKLSEDKDNNTGEATSISESDKPSQKEHRLSNDEILDSDSKWAMPSKLKDFSPPEIASEPQEPQTTSKPPSSGTEISNTYAIASDTAFVESRKICNEMEQAAGSGDGDLGVWKVCEKRVFPLMDLINLPGSLSPTGNRAKRRQARERRRQAKLRNLEPGQEDSKSASGNTSPDTTGLLDIPPNVPVLPVVSKVYPDVILHAQQLFQDRFPMSPFTTQLFEAVKARGRTSLMMGASVDLCNELIGFRWRVYNDLPYIVALLKEMEEGGVEFNRHTLDLVEGIQRERMSALNEDGGSSTNRNSWWESDAIHTAYQQLVGKTGPDSGWISRVKSHIGTESDLRKQRKIMWANAQQ